MMGTTGEPVAQGRLLGLSTKCGTDAGAAGIVRTTSTVPRRPLEI
jgi:hypothetical protein